MKDRVLIVFEAVPNIASKEDVLASEGLKSPHADVIMLDELRENKGLLLEYKGILDCTMEHKILNSMLQSGMIRATQDKLGEFYVSPRGFYVRKGPATNTLFVANFSSPGMEQYSKKVISDFKDTLKTLLMKCPGIANRIKFDEGLKDGIEIGNFLPGNDKKRVVLVSKIPARKETNTEYVTPIGIEIAERLLKIKKEAE